MVSLDSLVFHLDQSGHRCNLKQDTHNVVVVVVVVVVVGVVVVFVVVVYVVYPLATLVKIIRFRVVVSSFVGRLLVNFNFNFFLPMGALATTRNLITFYQCSSRVTN